MSRVTRVQRKLISSEGLCDAAGGGKGQLGQRCISAVSGTLLVRGQCFDDQSTSPVLGNSDSATFLREQGSLGFPSVVSRVIAFPTDLVCDTAAFQFMRDDLVDVVRSHSVRISEQRRGLLWRAWRQFLRPRDVFAQVADVESV